MAAPFTGRPEALKDGIMREVASTSTSIPDLKASLVSVSSTPSSTNPPKLHSLSSTYHIYHKKENHARISPTADPTHERFWGPSIKEVRAKRRAKKLAAQQQPQSNDWPIASSPSSSPALGEDGAFFLHTPYLAFHEPPRVLYAGTTKRTVPAVLIHSTLFWRKWKLQLGPSIAKRGVLDPRGVVCWRYHGGDAKAREANGRLLKGYKVRTWRLWGETGKKYVHKIKANRKVGLGPDPDILGDVVPEVAKKFGDLPDMSEKGAALSELEKSEVDYPVYAEEAVYLTWTSPFSRDTRRYHFQFRGINFYWKGTGTVKETRTCGWFLHFNHLKLVAQIPAPRDRKGSSDSVLEPEVCLGKYTCSIATKKSGKLDLFDEAIWRLVSEHMPDLLAPGLSDDDDGMSETGSAGGELSMTQASAVKKTLMYQLIVATAMCMVIGEKQKRETIKKIIELAVTEGAGGAS
ncbi:hypothetical protein K491DRAFT_783863 [Lophiostoma macrostomum CBS 122681]|uniref:Uncharacterized protein n=1 Tax=Lophiostoma macrostomum CBS 122681 TaxID=1314788 RepID=A0A6A6SLN5_9PLEO|nr:hypothetical protein K491DRAFT_783863 [Lophiostoma macrostomum CBS 122681]